MTKKKTDQKAVNQPIKDNSAKKKEVLNKRAEVMHDYLDDTAKKSPAKVQSSNKSKVTRNAPIVEGGKVTLLPLDGPRVIMSNT